MPASTGGREKDKTEEKRNNSRINKGNIWEEKY
jgi:hypothetical protein